MKKQFTGVSIVLLVAAVAVGAERRTWVQEVKHQVLRGGQAISNEVSSWGKAARNGIRGATRGVGHASTDLVEGGRRSMASLTRTTADLGRRASAGAKSIVDETVFQIAGPVGSESRSQVVITAAGQLESPILDPLFLKTHDIVLAWRLDTGGKLMRRSLILDDALIVEDMAKNVYSFRARNGIVQWIYPIPGPSQSPLIATARTVFVVANDTLYEIDRTIGRPRRRLEFPAPVGSPLAFDDTSVVIASWDRRIYAINRETRIREWTYLPTATAVAGVALAPNMAYIPDVNGRLVAYSPPDRRTEWTYKARDAIRVPMVLDDRQLFFPADDLYVHCVNRYAGTSSWKFPLDGYVRQPVWVTKERVYFSAEADAFYALTRDKGEIIWSVPKGGWPVAVGERSVYIEGPDNEIWCIDLKTGKRLWRVSRKPFAQVFRNTRTDHIYLCSATGELYALYLRGDHLEKKRAVEEEPVEPDAGIPAAPEPEAERAPPAAPALTPPADAAPAGGVDAVEEVEE
ncbi:PQQ-like beta-propeller repeat protein [bacterium]|nr:PQQ-like beta-propeller repeat protein [bacterium]